MFEIYVKRLPKGFLPIATDPFGNLVVIKLLTKDSGKVFFWDHEKENENYPTMKTLTEVAE